ncbi:MAG: GMC family oxidoreductase [Pseudomonadota bacterium]
MIIDYQAGGVPENIQSDVCIVGSGPAGITLALKLIDSGRDVTVLEAGGIAPSTEGQDFYRGKNLGRPYYPLQAARLRALGGTSGHWTGWCGPLDEHDFQVRDWIPFSGWPISLATLKPHYVEAQRVLKLGPFAYEVDDWADAFEGFPRFADENIVARHLQFSRPPLNFGAEYKQELTDAENVRLVLNANVTRLNLSESGRDIRSLSARSTTGKAGTVTARTFVLACGGIENARLLLASNNVNPVGVGNDRDLVGRFFMEHIEAPCASVYRTDIELIENLNRTATPSGQSIGTVFCGSVEKQAASKTGSGSMFISAPKIGSDSGWRSFLRLSRGMGEANSKESRFKAMGRVFSDFDSVAGGLGLRLRKKAISSRIFVEDGVIKLKSMCEQVPNPDSRVVLSDDQDVFGNPLADLDWQLTDLDRKTVRETAVLVGAEFERLRMGTVKLDPWLRDPESTHWSEDTQGGWHHMGTTRMSDSDATGVVDRNCKVHGIGNLYIAGSSVFSTGGYVNPTLSIVALAARLAEHLGGPGVELSDV